MLVAACCPKSSKVRSLNLPLNVSRLRHLLGVAVGVAMHPPIFFLRFSVASSCGRQRQRRRENQIQWRAMILPPRSPKQWRSAVRQTVTVTKTIRTGMMTTRGHMCTGRT